MAITPEGVTPNGGIYFPVRNQLTKALSESVADAVAGVKASPAFVDDAGRLNKAGTRALDGIVDSMVVGVCRDETPFYRQWVKYDALGFGEVAANVASRAPNRDAYRRMLLPALTAHAATVFTPDAMHVPDQTYKKVLYPKPADLAEFAEIFNGLDVSKGFHLEFSRKPQDRGLPNTITNAELDTKGIGAEEALVRDLTRAWNGSSC